MKVKKQQLELDMEQWTGFKLGKEFIKAVYRHSAYLAYTQITSWPLQAADLQQVLKGVQGGGQK